MELRQLTYFVAVAEELNFGRAALRLTIVQSSVSQQVRRLEAELGVQLLERTSRRVSLTEAGRRFLPEARAVLLAAHHAEATVSRWHPAPVDYLRLGTSAGLGQRLPLILAGVEGRLPSAERLRRVGTGELDVAFVRGAPAATGIRLLPVWREQLIVAFPARLARASPGPYEGDGIDIGQLSDLALRLPDREDNPPLVEAVLAGCRRAGFEPQLAPTAHVQDLIAMIEAGQPMWTVLYLSHAVQLTSHGTQICFRRVQDPLMAVETSLSVPDGRQVPMLTALLDASRSVPGPRWPLWVPKTHPSSLGDHRALVDEAEQTFRSS